jgi:hypothetical protein
LIPRLGPWVHWDPVRIFLQGWMQEYKSHEPAIPRRLSHPDLTARNLLRERVSGRTVSIDNELLGVGPGWIIDWRNSLLAKTPTPRFLDPKIGAFADRTWHLRLLGSAIDESNFEDAAKLTTVVSASRLDAQS